MRYHRLRLDLEDSSEDELAARLWLAGSTGVEVAEDASTGRRELISYFEEAPAIDGVVRALEELGHVVQVDVLEEEDWMAPYRAVTGPIELGAQFVVVSGDGPEADEVDEADENGRRRRLTVPAQQAFGTGSHATTRLAVDLLESLDLAGARVLDVGTGSGILCFVALSLSATSATGFDRETQSVVLARDNARRNELRADFFVGSAGAVSGHFEVVVANVLPDNLAADLPTVANLVPEGGRIIVSGVLSEGGGHWLQRWLEQGLRLVEERRLEEWSGWLLTRPLSVEGAST